MEHRVVRVGCAGWSIWKSWSDQFPERGSHLERYAQRMPAVEINSSFYRPHQPATYARWASSTPADFLFAVKVPKLITHQLRLAGARAELERFLGEAGELGAKLGPLLVQLPPSLALKPEVARRFFDELRALHSGGVVCEPRHQTWFTDEAESLLLEYQVARVAADPAPAPGANLPGGWPGLVYYRLHGSPEMYYSSYDAAALDQLTAQIEGSRQSAAVWCIFDNTAAGAATINALDLLQRLDIKWPPGQAQAETGL